MSVHRTACLDFRPEDPFIRRLAIHQRAVAVTDGRLSDLAGASSSAVPRRSSRMIVCWGSVPVRRQTNRRVGHGAASGSSPKASGLPKFP
jgi:hypothetical protein